MVTFRFYLVSVGAFFLALAVGVVVGSVLDEGISRGLQERLDRVERNLDETGAVIDAKNERIEELEDFARTVAPFAVEDRMPDTSTLVLVEPGIPNEPVEDTVARLREAGSFVEGIVWFEASWSLEDDEDRKRFAEIVGGDDSSVEDLHDAAIRSVLGGAAPESGTDGDQTPTTTTTTAGGEPEDADSGSGGDQGGGSDAKAPSGSGAAPKASDPVDFFASGVLGRLQEAGFVRVVPLGDNETQTLGSQPALVAVTGTASRLEVPGTAAVGAAETAGRLGIPAVLGEVYDQRVAKDPRGQLSTRAAELLDVPFSTVDDLEMVAGRVATVLALAQIRDGVVGRYGYGDGVDGVLPPWQGR